VNDDALTELSDAHWHDGVVELQRDSDSDALHSTDLPRQRHDNAISK